MQKDFGRDVSSTTNALERIMLGRELYGHLESNESFGKK